MLNYKLIILMLNYILIILIKMLKSKNLNVF